MIELLDKTTFKTSFLSSLGIYFSPDINSWTSVYLLLYILSEFDLYKNLTPLNYWSIIAKNLRPILPILFITIAVLLDQNFSRFYCSFTDFFVF